MAPSASILNFSTGSKPGRPPFEGSLRPQCFNQGRPEQLEIHGLGQPFQRIALSRKFLQPILDVPETALALHAAPPHVPDILSKPAEDMLASAKWRTVSWRTGTKGKLKARFAVPRVRVADGPPQRIRDKGQQHLPGDEAWLLGEKKYYLPAKTDLRTLAATIQGALER